MYADHLPTEEVPQSLPARALFDNVQELATSSEEPPVRYIRRDDYNKEKEEVIADGSGAIPIINLSRLAPNASITEKEEEMSKLKSALTSWGFFQAIGHGIPQNLLDDMYNVSKQFFDLPKDEKQRYMGSKDDEVVDLQGYGSDTFPTDDMILDWSDRRLYLLMEPVQERKLSYWPDPPMHFGRTLDDFGDQTRSVADIILKAMASNLGLVENDFINQLGHDHPTLYARFNYYPPCSRPDLVYGIKAHADGGSITILLQDPEVEGLQVLKDDKWVNVPCIPGALVVNVADQMEIASNGIFKSTVHRVVTNTERERLSLAMFYSSNFEKEIEPAAGLIDESNPRMFRKVKVKDYLAVFFPNYMQGKRATDWASV